jgi:hypothetical protein
MNTPHHQHIDTAFLQLSFAIKLWHFLDKHPIDKEIFDIALTIEEPRSRVRLSQNEFHTYLDIQLAAENNISISFGTAAITLWEAIREHTGLESWKLNPRASARENLAALSYMLRCCFAHGTALPVWSIQHSKYKTTYCIANKTIDLSCIKNHQSFDYSSIGGYETLWQLKAEAYANGLL